MQKACYFASYNNEEKRLSVTREMKNYLASILHILDDPRFESHKKLPMLIQLYEQLEVDGKKKEKVNKWRYG